MAERVPKDLPTGSSNHPINKRRHAMSDAKAAVIVNQDRLALGNERFEADGATFVRNRRFPEWMDANHVAYVTASTPQEIDRLLERVEKEFDGFPHRRFDLEPDTAPTFQARLVQHGYRRGDEIILLLRGELRGAAKPADIRLVKDDSDWDAIAGLVELEWQEYRERTGDHSARISPWRQVGKRGKSPPVRYWLAYLDGHPRSYFSSWAGVDGIGQVEDLFTHPEYRHRGLATALVHRCVAESRALGAESVIITADPDDTPRLMFSAMGFEPVALHSSYGKEIT